MRKLLASLGISALLLSGCSGIGQPDNVHEDVTTTDTRDEYKRSADIQGLVLAVDSYSLIYTEYKGEQPAGRGYFFVVNVSLINKTNSPREFDPINTSAITGTGYEYDMEHYGSDKIDGVNDPITWIAPRTTTYTTLVFEMPSSTTPDFLLVKQPNSDKYYSIDIPEAS